MQVYCPVCGEMGTLYERKNRNRKYIYINHQNHKHCYLGPADGYKHVVEKYVQVFGTGYGLTNVKDVDLITMMLRILDVIESRNHNGNSAKMRADLKLVRDRIDKILRSVEEEKTVE